MSDSLAIPSGRAVYPAAPPQVQPKQDFYPGKEGYGPLTGKDKELLEEYCGYEFVWPPVPGLPFPREAAFVAEMRVMQGSLGDADLFSQLSRHQNFRMRMSGDSAFSDEFLAFVVAKSQSSPATAAFLANGGKSATYA